MKKIYCSKCSREFPISTLECPYCGIFLENNNKNKNKIKKLIVFASVLIAIAFISSIVYFSLKDMNEDIPVAEQKYIDELTLCLLFKNLL